MRKPLPDFSTQEWMRRSPRAKLLEIRAFVLDHEGPIPQPDVRGILAQMCMIAVALIGESHSASKFDLDQFEIARLLHGEVAMYVRNPS